MIRAGIVADTSGLAAVASTTKQRNITLKAVKAGAKLVAADAKARAPRRPKSGALRQSIGIKPVKGTKGRTLAYAVVGARKKVVKQVPVGKSGRTVKAVPAFYSHLVEGGTKPHRLGSGAKLGRNGKADTGQDRGGMHPGAKPKPFLRPAFEATKARAEQAATEVMAAEIKKALAAAPKSRAKGK